MLQIYGAVGNVQLMQKINRLKVLNYIRQNNGAARPEIAKSTGLSPSSVTNIVTYLLNKKLVVETGRVDSKEVGRKAVLIRFNPGAANVISISIEVNKITIALTDLDGNLIRKKEINLYKQEKDAKILKEVEKGIGAIIKEDKGTQGYENIIGIGIAVSGLVTDDEKLEISASLRWKGLSLREYFEKLFHLPVYIQNNSKTKALAVLREDGIQPDENVIFLDLAMGVGMINFSGNEINEAVVGEIGHTTVKKDGPPCFCGNHGCLEVMCSVEAIILQCTELLKSGGCLQLKQIIENKNSGDDEGQSILYDTVLEAFAAGDKDVRRVLEESGEYLGIGIANIINIFNPSRIIIDGDTLLSSDFIYEKALDEARSRAYEQFTKGLVFSKVRINTEKAIRGISLYVTDKVFDLDGPEF